MQMGEPDRGREEGHKMKFPLVRAASHPVNDGNDGCDTLFKYSFRQGAVV